MNNILVVDDFPDNCHQIAEILKPLDVKLFYCHESSDAINHVREIEPSLVLLDSDMPQVDGYQIINQMWSDDDLRQIPVLLMTSHFADRKQLLHRPLLEVVDSLPKPINPAMLLDRVQMALTMRSHQQRIVSILDDGGQAIRKRHEAVLAIDREGRITFANATALALLRTNHQMIFGVYLESVFEEPNHGVKSAWSEHPVQMMCAQGNVLQVESCTLCCADGSNIRVKLAAIPLEKDPGLSMVIAFRQISKNKDDDEQSQNAQLQAYDALTGTFSRTAFEQLVDDVIRNNQGKGSKVAVVQLDLAHFNHVNESLGHEFGDQMLKDVVARIQRVLRPTDRIGRIGGDVFAILIHDVKTPKNAASVAQKLIDAIKEGFLLNGYELYIGCSLGIATFPECGKESSSLMKNAAIAVEGAKLVGTNAYKFFTAKMNDEMLERVQREASFRHCLEMNELSTVVAPLHCLHGSGWSQQKQPYLMGLAWDHSRFGTQNTAHLLSLFERYNVKHLYQMFLMRLFEQIKIDDDSVLMVPVTVASLTDEYFIEELIKTHPQSQEKAIWMIQEGSVERLNLVLKARVDFLQRQGIKVGMQSEIGASLMKGLDLLSLDFVTFTSKLQENEDRRTVLRNTAIRLAAQCGLAVFTV